MKSQRISKIIATLLLLTQVVCILPAEEIIQERNYGRARLEQYLSRAERERNAQDYERIAEEGLMLAMSEWESANTYLRETDYTTYEAEKAKVKTEYEKITSREYALWYANKKLEDEAAVKSSELSKELSKKAEEYREKYKESGASKEESKQSEAEWEDYANAIVEKYMQELNANNASLVPELTEELKGYNEETIKGIYETVAKDYESRIYKEYERIYAAEKNQMMSELLYDTKSTKKLSASEAAEVIAKETAKEVKTETDQAMTELFNDFESTIEGVSGEEIELSRENWLNNFEKVFNESIEKWNEAERKFLAERNEWESTASEVYEKNEQAWAEGYKVIQEKRKAWFEDIERKLVEGRKSWDESEETLNEQLSASYAELEMTLAKEKESKNKMLELQISIYEQSRNMLSMVSSGLAGIAETFYGNYYKDRYAYWKTEDTNKEVDEFFGIVEKFKQSNKPGSFFSDDKEIKNAISLVKKLQADCKSEEVKTLLNNLVNEDGSSGWLQILQEYKSKTLEAKESLYKLTGCIYNGEEKNPNDDLVYFNELDYEIIKANVSLEYWQEEYDVVQEVRKYAEETDSKTETDETTQTNLENAIGAYETALSNYEKAVEELESYKSNVDIAQTEVEKKYAELSKAKGTLEEAKNAYSEILVVYLGVESTPLKEKINSLIVEYEKKKSQSDEEEFKAYYEALVEYTQANQKQKYLEMKNTIENGTAGGSLSIGKIEENKTTVTQLIETVNLKDDSYLIQISEYVAKISIYCGETANKLSNYIEEWKTEQRDNGISEDEATSEKEKQEYESVIIKYLETLKEFWERELTKKTEAIYYLENGTFKTLAATDAKDKKETELKNYLTAIINATSEWKEELGFDFSGKEEILLKIEALNENTGSELVTAVKAEIEKNSTFRKLMQGQDVFNSSRLMDLITCEAKRLNEKSFENETIRNNIKELYSAYTLKPETSNGKAIEQINKIISETKLEELREENVEEFIEKLRKNENDLNMYGQVALENYISSIIDYVAIKSIKESKLSLGDLNKQRDDTITKIESLTSEVNSIGIFANYGIADVKAVLEALKETSYTEISAELEEYAAYLIISKLYSTDLEENKDKESLKKIITRNIESLTAEKKAETWENAFNNLDEALQNKICEKILSIYYFDEKAKDYEKSIEALNDYLSLPEDPEAYKLAINSKVITPELSSIIKVNEFIREYFYLQQQITQLELEIQKKEEAIEVSKEEKTQLEEAKEKADAAYEELLNNDTNNYFEYIKDYNVEDIMWLTMSLAGKEQFFIYLQTCSTEEYEQIKKKLGEKFAEKITETDKEYLESYNKINEIAEKYCGIVDGDVETWLEKLNETNLTEAEKAKIKGILKGTEINSNYYTYEKARENILSTTGATQLLYKRINELREKLSNKVIEVYTSENKNLMKLQTEYNFIESKINSIQKDDISWVIATQKNGIKTESSMDETTLNAMSKWIDNNENPYDKILEEKLAISNQHKKWLEEQSVIYENNLIDINSITEPISQYQEKMNSAYAAYVSVHDCRGIESEIKSLNKSYELSTQNKENVNNQLKTAEETLKKAEREVKNKTEEWQTSVNKVISESNIYNKKVENADDLFTKLKSAEKNKRIAEEKEEYAKSVYLKNLGEVAEKEYISPQEKEVIIQYSYEKAKVRVDVLKGIKATTHETSSEYTSAMESYEEAVKKHYLAMMIKTETDKGLVIQEDLVREKDAKLQAEYSKITNQSEITAIEAASNTVQHVYITENEDGSYSVRLKKDGDGDCTEILEKYLIENEVEEKIPGGKRVITQGMYDARNWVSEVYGKGEDYIKDLMIAAVFITKKEYSFNTGDMPEEVQGVNFRNLVNSSKSEVIKASYDKIMGMEGGEEDLAKYLMFNYNENNKNGVITNVFTENYIKSALTEKVYEKAKESVVRAYEEKKSIALAAEITAAEYTAAAFIAWIPNPVLLGLAAAALATAAVFEVQAYKIKHDVLNHVERLINGQIGNFNAQNNKNVEIIKNIATYKAELEKEWKLLNKMYTGSETGSTDEIEITKDNVVNALKARTTNLSINYDTTIEDLYTEEVIEVSGAKTATTITDAMNQINNWYSQKEENAKTHLENVITDLKENQRENQSVYEAKLNKNAELSQEQKDKLHELALKVSDESLSVAEKKSAKAEYEKYKKEILNSGKTEYEEELKALATKTYREGSWSTDVYLKDMQELWAKMYPENVDLTSSTENYTQKALNGFKSIVLFQFDAAATRQLEKLQEEQNKERQQLATKRKNWEEQMSVLITIAESEWDKAGASLVSGYNTWKKTFETELAEKNAQWYENYENFLESKQEWINDQYLYAVNVANAKVIDQSGLDVESTIAEALADTAIEAMNHEPINVEEYTEEIIAKSALSEIMGNIDSLSNKGKNAAITRKHGYKINTSSREAMQKAEETMQSIEKDMKEASAKLAAEQANRIIEQTIEASMERIEKENEGMRDWEESLVRNNGYTVDGKNIKREAPIDSTVWETIYETQTVAYYEDFTTSKPVLSVSLAGTMLEGLTSSGIMQMVSQANREIENWNIEIFGDMEKDADGNLVQKQWTIPRSDSKTIHATENSEVKSAYEKLMNNEQNQKDKARYEELSKREYESLTESEKEELNNLSRNLVTVRDGKLGEWIGYAPQFKTDLDLSKNKDENVADKGLGQMGAIMLDFQWNSMRASQGWAKLSLPMYDQPLWKNNGSWFEPPTLRSVSSVVMEIVGTAVGQSWWLGYADDLLFAAMDVGGGYKSASEVGLELAKTAATAVIGKGIGAGSNALGDLAGKAMQGAGKVANFAVQAGISMTTNYVTSVANSAVQSLYIGEDGKLGFKTEDFTKSLYSADTISGALGAGITAGLNATTIGYNNQYVNGFNSQQIGNIKTFNSLMGGLTTNTSSLLMGGNANFNLLSFKGVGMLEFSFGKDGVSSKIGMGGTNITIQNLVGAFGGATNLHKNSQINKTGYDKTTLDALRSQWGFGDEVAKNQLDDIINGDTVLKFDAEGSEVAQSITENGQKIIHINSTLNDGFIDLGLTLQHEAHRDGIVGDEQRQQIETTKAVLGHTVMAKKMQNDSLYKSMMNDIIDTNQNLQNDLAVFDYAVETGDWGAFGSYANAAYDSSADYWRVHEDDTVTWDGQLNFYKDGETDKNDAEAGKLLDYRNLDEVIESAKKDGLETVMLGGIEVDVERLMEIQGHNNRIIEFGSNSKKENSKDLLDDGFITYNDAQTYGEDIYLRLQIGKIPSLKQIPDLIEHYSIRYILNENDIFAEYFSDKNNIEQWTSDVIRGESEKEFNGAIAKLLSAEQSVYHGLEAYKWCFEDGREIVFGPTLDSNYFPTNVYEFEKDERFLGTYNWFNADNFMMHTFADVIPYIKWGNTPDDMENTIVINRIYPIVETYEDSKRREYLERNRYQNIIEGYKKYYSTETK